MRRVVIVLINFVVRCSGKKSRVSGNVNVHGTMIACLQCEVKCIIVLFVHFGYKESD
jgi:hypothetical protein